MQILIPIKRVNTENIFFTEKRRNVILDGNFVKILYSTEHFEMNGLHMSMHIESACRIPGAEQGIIRLKNAAAFSEKPQKFVELFDPNFGENAKQIELLCKMEHDIIQHYITLHSPHKNAVHNLKTQLMSGSFRFSCETAGVCGAEEYCSENRIRVGEVDSPQINRNAMKVYSDARGYLNKFNWPENRSSDKREYALKISGIWETNFNVGITVKFIYIC